MCLSKELAAAFIRLQESYLKLDEGRRDGALSEHATEGKSTTIFFSPISTVEIDKIKFMPYILVLATPPAHHKFHFA